MSEPTLTVNGKPTGFLSARVENGPNVFEGVDLRTGTTRRGTVPFEGATQVQQAFDLAHVEFWRDDEPAAISFEAHGKRYDRVLSLSLEPDRCSCDIRVTAKIAAAGTDR